MVHREWVKVETNRQTDGEAETDRQTDRQTDRRKDRGKKQRLRKTEQTDGHADRELNLVLKHHYAQLQQPSKTHT